VEHRKQSAGIQRRQQGRDGLRKCQHQQLRARLQNAMRGTKRGRLVRRVSQSEISVFSGIWLGLIDVKGSHNVIAA